MIKLIYVQGVFLVECAHFHYNLAQTQINVIFNDSLAPGISKYTSNHPMDLNGYFPNLKYQSLKLFVLNYIRLTPGSSLITR